MSMSLSKHTHNQILQSNSKMNLYDYLTQKMYSNMPYHHSIVSQLEDAAAAAAAPGGSPGPDRLRQRRKANIFAQGQRSSLAELDEESEPSSSEASETRKGTFLSCNSDWDNTLQCKNDLVLRQNYERYQFLRKRPDALKTMAEHRDFFDDMLKQINRIKLFVGSMAAMSLVSWSLVSRIL